MISLDQNQNTHRSVDFARALPVSRRLMAFAVGWLCSIVLADLASAQVPGICQPIPETGQRLPIPDIVRFSQLQQSQSSPDPMRNAGTDENASDFEDHYFRRWGEIIAEINQRENSDLNKNRQLAGLAPQSEQKSTFPVANVYISNQSPRQHVKTASATDDGLSSLLIDAASQSTNSAYQTPNNANNDWLLGENSAEGDLLAGGTKGDSLLGADGKDSLLDESGNDDDPLANLGPSPSRERERQGERKQATTDKAGVDPHAEIFAETLYPSAATCAKCHKQIYDEWRVSGHAYAAVSPMFQRFEQAISDLTRGTVGYFCQRCHAPVATQLSYPREASILEGPTVLREGITCVACHRVVERYGRTNGERRIEPGDIFAPVVGNIGGDGVHSAIARKDHFKVKTNPHDKSPGQPIHLDAIKFEQLSDSSFCASCHQVVVQPGIALEIVYQQYRSGPACKKGVSCQDCHMGQVPGKPSGYATAPAAVMSGKSVTPHRKHANHMFYGPGYPIAHPGIFPHNEKSLRWRAADWLEFDWRKGWGTPEFEKTISQQRIPAESFPPAWRTTDDRRDARKIVEDNFKLIAAKRVTSQQILENGSAIDGPFFAKKPRLGKDLKFHFLVQNTSEGHNMPSGSLGAQPQLWLNAVLIDPDGQRIWESGYLDGNGDLADLQSRQVQKGLIPRDKQLFNMQTKFLITTTRGTDREMPLPVNIDIDPLPFFRPGAVPYTVLNHPPFIRMEAHSIPPLDSRKAKYKVDASLLTKPGTYRLSVRMRSRPEPIYFVRYVNGTSEMERAFNEGIIDVHPYSTEFYVE